MTRPFAADDFDAIRARRDALSREEDAVRAGECRCGMRYDPATDGYYVQGPEGCPVHGRIAVNAALSIGPFTPCALCPDVTYCADHGACIPF